MKTVLLLLASLALSGCTAMSALGLGPADLVPSLRYCDSVQYVRNGTSMEVHAQCKVPAGG
jgi:hypothetical protein